MITSLLFDRSGSADIDDFAAKAAKLSERTVLWVSLESPDADELADVCAAFGLDATPERTLARSHPVPQVQLHDAYIHVVTIFPPDKGSTDSSAMHALDAYVGRNWLVTSYDSAQSIVDEFRELAAGAGQIGALDALSFLATLLESVIVGYTEAVEEIEETLEDFDAEVLASTDRDVESKVLALVEARSRVAQLRRALAPHLRVFMTLSHTELDTVSTEMSGVRFTHLASSVAEAMNSARDARETVVNSFDMLILRTEHRTNEIVKVLTLTSILFLPGALIAAIMGMNVNLVGGEFISSNLFWGTLIIIGVVGIGTLTLARLRRWI